YRERDYYDFEDREKPLGFNSANMLGGEIALVHDTTQWNYWTPVAGSRLRYSLSQTIGVTPDSYEYTSNFADLRRYIRISDRNNLAFRLVGGYNMGDDSPEYFLGGGNTIRGYPYSSLYGTWMALANAEFRFPLIDYVVTPIPGFVFGFFRGVAFFDVGTAWSDWNEESPYPEDKQWFTKKEDLYYTKFTPYTSDGGFHMVHLKPSFGTGFRWSLGFFDLKFDWAWPTDFASVEPDPVFHFTIGYDY
ncbi:MAG: BamA/TamA family outer membrane protein, partial [bacterium]|nr:BamA/TamA family outer membrane protein [bacterium]